MNLFESAEYAKSLSTCFKRPVGASLAINNTVVSLGFNHGGDEDCTCKLTKGTKNPNVKHAEVHCLENYEFLSNEYSEMAITYMPCLDCSKYLVSKGIKAIYYLKHEFEPEKQLGINFLKENGVIVRNEWSY